MKRALKYSFATLCVLVVSAPVIYFVAVSAALRAHAAEDRIVFGSKRVEEAINDYTLKRGSAPRTLEALVPEFIESIPSFEEISKVDYRLSADAKEWTLDLYWTGRKAPRIYRRTNAGLSVEDAARKIDMENGCYVLKVR